MESFIRSCQNFEQYPQNIVQHDGLSHTLKAQSVRLGLKGDRIFNERMAEVDLLDYELGGENTSTCVTSLIGMKETLRQDWRSPLRKSDPQCRFIFITSPNSRAALRISRSMLNLLFTHHQVVPCFLDFIFPFCKKVDEQDSLFSGLRDESQLDPRRRGPDMPSLNRSGKELRICYNLRSVEPSGNREQPFLPWSIRQSAIYHSFDLKTGQTLWINVKGNRLIKDRIVEATASNSSNMPPSCSEAFSASLATHLILCDWSGENWRWYINNLEDEIRRLTSDAVVIPIDKPPSPIPPPVPFAMSPRIQTGNFSPLPRSATAPTPRTQWSPMSPIFPSRTINWIDPSPATDAAGSTHNCYSHDRWAKAGFMNVTVPWKSVLSFFSRIRKPHSSNICTLNKVGQQPLSFTGEKPEDNSISGGRMQPEDPPPTFSEDSGETPPEFTFSDIQRLQVIEDKTQEALLVLRLNTDVLQQLRQHYDYATSHAEFSAEIKSDCATDLARFNKCVLGVEKDLQMLQSRTETLLRLIANRKNILNDILQYRSMKVNEDFARKAHVTAHHMALMTIEMHAIAKKTEQETVSMRVITTVTLFFLPATFIATFMSTDILKFENGRRNFQSNALDIYLAIALPLTAITFFAWWVISRVAKKNDQLNQESSYSDAV